MLPCPDKCSGQEKQDDLVLLPTLAQGRAQLFMQYGLRCMQYGLGNMQYVLGNMQYGLVYCNMAWVTYNMGWGKSQTSKET